MVIAPPLTDLRYPHIRWQTVFVSTTPLVGKSAQNDERCGIYATVWPQLSQFPSIRPRLFRNTGRRIAIAGELAAGSPERMPPAGVAASRLSQPPKGPGPFNVR